jgi:hypothetical protein
MLADEKGQVVYKNIGLVDRDKSKITKLLDGMLQEQSEVKTVTIDGSAYMPRTLERSGESQKARRRDRFPSLACASDGKVYLVFTTNCNSNSDVFMRVFDGKAWSQDKPVAATPADEYDGRVMVDKQNRVWVSWTSNADGKNYNIFATTFSNPAEPVKPVQITDANDDAMHSRMACDNKGRIWMTYYKWEKMGQASRDKEVYVRRWEGGKWSDEIQVSPTDVPVYEDHSDPAITTYDDSVIVCWSWDFHRPKGYTKESQGPTIFARSIADDLGLGKPVAVSGKEIDMTPAIIVGNDKRIWYAWDSLGRLQKTLCLKDMNITGRNRGADTRELNKPAINICTPSFAISPTGVITLFWSQTLNGRQWVLKQSELDPKANCWQKPKTIESKGNPRYCSASYDKKGQLWVSYSAETDIGHEIIVRKLERNRNTH